MTRRERIIAAARTSAARLLYYDRKEDEGLGLGEIERAVAAGEITIEDIVQPFVQVLEHVAPPKIVTPVPPLSTAACAVCGWGDAIHGDGAGRPHAFTPKLAPGPYDDGE